jgi:hypothetical protein
MLFGKLSFVLVQPTPLATKLPVKRLSRMRSGHSDNDWPDVSSVPIFGHRPGLLKWYSFLNFEHKAQTP